MWEVRCMSDDKIVELTMPADSPQRLARPRRPRAPTPEAATGAGEPGAAPPPPPVATWLQFIRDGADDFAIGARFADEAQAILAASALDDYCVLGIMDADTRISDYELDRVFAALQATNPKREQNVLLILLSTGGSIEPAYQMSK